MQSIVNQTGVDSKDNDAIDVSTQLNCSQNNGRRRVGQVSREERIKSLQDQMEQKKVGI